MQRLSNLTSLQLFQLIRYGTFILIGIGFAKQGVSLSQIGSFETFILLNGLVSFFWVSGIINSLLSLYPKQTEEEKRVLLFNVFVSLAGFSLTGAVLLYLFAGNLLAFLNKTGNGELVKAAVVYLLLNTPCFITEYILYLKEKKWALVLYAITNSLVTITAALLPVILGYEVIFSLYALISVAVCKLLFTALVLKQHSSFVFNIKLLTENCKLALPLMFSFLISGSAEYIDGMIVKWKFDDMFFAIYRYGAKELPILLIVSTTLSSALIPAIAADLNKGVEELKAKSLQLMNWFFPLTIVLLLTSPWLYKLVFSEKFTYSALIFNIYLLLIIPRVLFPQTILTARGQTKFILISALIEMSINATLSIYLAEKIGLPGVAVGTLVAYSADKIFLMSVNYFLNGILPGAYLHRLPFILYTVATFAAFGIGYWIMK